MAICIIISIANLKICGTSEQAFETQNIFSVYDFKGTAYLLDWTEFPLKLFMTRILYKK